MKFMRRLLVTTLVTTLAAVAFTGTAFAADAKVAGEWDFTVESANGPGTPHFSLKQDGSAVSGNYKGAFGEAPVTGMIKGNDLSLVIKISAQGQELLVTYTGVVDGSTVKGKVTLGDMGEGTFTGKKAG